MASKFETLNGQTITVDIVGGVPTLRIAKDGHNRAVAKLDAATAMAVANALAMVDAVDVPMPTAIAKRLPFIGK